MITNLASYQIDHHRGFLPKEDPIKCLPPAFAQWDKLGEALPDLLLTGRVRSVLERLQTPDLTQLESEAQLERALLLISTMGMAYVWGLQPAVKRIPAALAIPWQQLADKLGRLPIIHHASAVLNNWRRLDQQGDLSPENLACIQHILGGMDEQWFFTVTVAIEAAGAPALWPLVEMQQAVAVENSDKILIELQRIAPIFREVLAILLRMYERCDPRIFYLRVRPFLVGWDKEGLIYEGISEEPIKLNGGSAAQSSLIQAYDAGLGIEHLHKETRPFLTLMRNYMPPLHRCFIEDLEAGPSIYDYVKKHQQDTPALADAFNHCVEVLAAIRKAHMEIAVRYILHQSAEGEKGGLGTGGTSFVPFLSQAHKETQRRLI